MSIIFLIIGAILIYIKQYILSSAAILSSIMILIEYREYNRLMKYRDNKI
jgi:hypothetical protein